MNVWHFPMTPMNYPFTIGRMRCVCYGDDVRWYVSPYNRLYLDLNMTRRLMSWSVWDYHIEFELFWVSLQPSGWLSQYCTISRDNPSSLNMNHSPGVTQWVIITMHRSKKVFWTSTTLRKLFARKREDARCMKFGRDCACPQGDYKNLWLHFC